MSNFRPSIKLKDIAIQDWDRLRELARERGKPYADREETIAIMTKSRDWVISICKMYRKGVWELTLNAIRNPFKEIEKLREIKEKNWRWAEFMARKLVEEL